MMRQRSSSRWSRNGISPVGDLGMGMSPCYYTAVARKSRRGSTALLGRAQQVARQARLVTVRIILDDAIQHGARRRVLLLRDERERVLVERGRCGLRLRVLVGDELVNRVRRRGVLLLGEGLPDVELGRRRLLELRVLLQ